MSYEEHIRLITELTTLDPDHFFTYRGLPLETAYDNIYAYVQKHLDTLSEEYNCEPAKLLFYKSTDDEGINAYADVNSWVYLIGLNDQLLSTVSDKCFGGDKSLKEHPELTTYSNTIEKSFNVSISLAIFQSAISFCFYHELGHHIQGSSNISQSRPEFSKSSNTEFDQQNHIDETDADIFAAKMTGELACTVWHNLPEGDKNGETLIKITSIIAASIGYLFFILNDSPIYLRQETHPHPFVRLSIVSTLIAGYVSNKASKLLGLSDVTIRDIIPPILILTKAISESLEGRKNTYANIDSMKNNHGIALDYAKELIDMANDWVDSATNKSNKGNN